MGDRIARIIGVIVIIALVLFICFSCVNLYVECHARGGVIVKNMFDWPVCAKPMR